MFIGKIFISGVISLLGNESFIFVLNLLQDWRIKEEYIYYNRFETTTVIQYAGSIRQLK